MKTRHRIGAVACTTLLAFCSGLAQLCSLHGRVVDAAGGEPMELVNVFLANTTSGVSTDIRGMFALTEVPPGDYDIVVSRVGYERAIQPLHLTPGSDLELSFELARKELQTDEVEVVSPDPSEWRRLFKQFVGVFFGETTNAAECTILNPYQLNLQFDEQRQTLIARCDTIMLVANRALGYRIAIDIEQFEWEQKKDIIRYSIFPRFEGLAGTPEDSARWERRRRDTYKGSLRHFLSSIVKGIAADEMFAVFSGSLDDLTRGNGMYVAPEELEVVPDMSPGVFRLAFGGWIRVDYRGRYPVTRSLLTLMAPMVRIDREGIVLTKFGTLTRGDWSLSRIGDLLPIY